MAFSKPASGDNFTNGDNDGRLLLIDPLSVKTGVTTSASPEPVDVIVANVVVLDGDDAGHRYEDTYIFGKVLFNSLKGRIGDDPVLGRLGRGPKVPGKHPSWILKDFTDADVKVAEAYIAANPVKPKVSSPIPTSTSGDKPPF